MNGQVLTPEQLKVGMRISIHPHATDFEQIILTAVEEAQRRFAKEMPTADLDVMTDHVATYVGVKSGDPAQLLAQYASTLIHTAALESKRQYLSCHILLSRGCQDLAGSDLDPADLPAEKVVFLPLTGLPVSAAWSIYPLSEGGASCAKPIQAAIEEAKNSGLSVSTDHFVTKLHGDLSVVLAVIIDTWAAAGKHIPHVVSHATISVDPLSI